MSIVVLCMMQKTERKQSVIVELHETQQSVVRKSNYHGGAVLPVKRTAYFSRLVNRMLNCCLHINVDANKAEFLTARKRFCHPRGWMYDC